MKQRSLTDIDTIFIHCTATPGGKDVTVAEIDSWHRERGFDMIGYHYVIDNQGKIHKGRELTQVGAHAKGHNANSIGIAYVGGVDDDNNAKDTLRPIQKNAMSTLLLALKCVLQTPLKVKGHREVSNKACPSFDVKEKFQWEIEQLSME